MIEYRKACINDIDLLAGLRTLFLCEANHVEDENEKILLFDNNKQFLQTAISNCSFVSFIAAKDGEAVATSGLSLYHLPPNKKCLDGKVAYISNIYTIPQYRKKGIATRLFSLTVQEAIERGHKKILLNATDMGRPIYEKFGFKDAQNDMVFYAD